MFLVRRDKGSFAVFPPFSTGSIALYHINGQQLGRWYFNRASSWFSLPIILKNGIYTVRCTDSRNHAVTQTIPIFR